MNRILDYEKKNFKKLQNLKLLPNKVKQFGIGLAIVSFVTIIAGKFLFEDYMLLRAVIKNILLISLLLISISRDKMEDEMTIKLRAQSYGMAFIFGVLYALTQPFANLFVDFLLQEENPSFTQLSVTQVLVFMLLVQLSAFYFSKRMR